MTNKKITFISIVVTIFAIISFLFLDKTIAYYFHNHIKDGIYHFIKLLSKLGQAEYFLIPSLLVYLIYKNRDEFIKKSMILIFSSVVISGIIVNIIKIIFGRARPPLLFKEDIFGFTWFHFGHLYASFPSGHTTTAFSGFIALAFIFPKYKYLFVIFAIIIALTRVLLSMHYLSDVLMGSLLGSWTTYLLYKKIFKEKN